MGESRSQQNTYAKRGGLQIGGFWIQLIVLHDKNLRGRVFRVIYVILRGMHCEENYVRMGTLCSPICEPMMNSNSPKHSKETPPK